MPIDNGDQYEVSTTASMQTYIEMRSEDQKENEKYAIKTVSKDENPVLINNQSEVDKARIQSLEKELEILRA